MEKVKKSSGKPPKPLKILVRLFHKSKKADKGGHEQQRRQRQQQQRSDNATGAAPAITATAASPYLGSSVGHGHGGGLDTVSDAAATTSALMLYTEMEALHLSRADNPYVAEKTSQLQLSASQDYLDQLYLVADRGHDSDNPLSPPFRQRQRYSSHSHSLASPEPLSFSPTRSCDPLELSDIHTRLVRSPPPLNWPEGGGPRDFPGGGGPRDFPLSPRSTGTFSPDSSDGLELDGGGGPGSGNYYTRSQSEEHILSPCRELLRSGLFSPTRRGATTPDPELQMTMSMVGTAGTAGDGNASPRNPRQVRGHGAAGRRGLEEAGGPLRNQMTYDNGAISHSTYTMSSGLNGSVSRRSFVIGGPASAHRSQLLPGGGKKSSGDSFFSSWRSRRSRRASGCTSSVAGGGGNGSDDAKSMENLQVDVNLRFGPCSPSARKSICSMGTSPRNGPTLFTRYRSASSSRRTCDPDSLFIP